MDNKFLEFCEDVKNALIEQDKFMYQKMTNDNVSNFYENDWRGLGFFSTTEPILNTSSCPNCLINTLCGANINTMAAKSF